MILLNTYSKNNLLFFNQDSRLRGNDKILINSFKFIWINKTTT